MLVIPVPTGTLGRGADLAAPLGAAARPGDVVVVSSKAVAAVEGRAIPLDRPPSEDAARLSAATGRSPAFCQALLEETRRLRGEIRGTCPGAALTEVRPEDLRSGSILVANAGLDESNAPEGTAIGWPLDPPRSAAILRERISAIAGGTVAVLLTDSCCLPRRRGVVAIALVASGIDPFLDLRGTRDLFGRELRITSEAVADQLATAGNAVMGNADQSTPAAIVRDHGLALGEFEGWVPGIPAEEDLFRGIV